MSYRFLSTLFPSHDQRFQAAQQAQIGTKATTPNQNLNVEDNAQQMITSRKQGGQKSIGQRGVDLPLEKATTDSPQQAFQAAQQAQIGNRQKSIGLPKQTPAGQPDEPIQVPPTNIQPAITDIEDGRRDSRDARDGRGYEDDYGSGQTPPAGS